MARYARWLFGAAFILAMAWSDSVSAKELPIIQRWSMNGVRLVTQTSISFSAAVKKVFELHKVPVPGAVIDVAMKAAGVNDRGIEIGVIHDKKNSIVSIIISKSSIMRATRIVRKGGLGLSDKGTWYINTGYNEYVGGPNGKGEKVIFTAPILWLE